MIIHKRNNLKGQQPLCWNGVDQDKASVVSSDIDKVDCVDCLRMLAKDAVLYGNMRKARRSGR